MSGLIALLDDIAALAKLTAASLDDVGALTAKASAKAAGVVIDDAAVTPQYVRGLEPKRELPIIWKITRGSLVNKLLIILPALLLLNWLAPWALPWLLILGGTYLAFEGAEKVWHKLLHRDEQPLAEAAAAASETDADTEKRVVSGAIRTDFILSAEIMVIAMNEVRLDNWMLMAIVLILVALAITFGVYGTVGLLVKIDDIGLALTTRKSKTAQRVGQSLVAIMPRVMTFIGVVGTLAMLWVGGHILLVQSHAVGLAEPYGFVHGIAESVLSVAGVGAVLSWVVETLISMVLGFVVGSVVAGVIALIHAFAQHKSTEPATRAANAAEESGPAQGTER
ncbi:DUF808 domain-containing protein [Gulosibacter hominis]|uniref:DUF808 domain-containing protein n=1 Tax=Gulosibacter hominis TaxID=2770504 RepID=UPI001919E96F|nr:DUF808 domain-containing protein [Gulosibacter hominis]